LNKYGIDTNVLIRYIVQDDLRQSQKSTQFLEEHCSVETPGHISLIVLCEVVWVLRSAYGYAKDEILKVLQLILSTPEFTIESSVVAWGALRQYKLGKADYPDFIIGQLNRINGCVATVTFDQKAGQSNYFQLL